ncbi:MAG: hypothetical protein AAF604_19990 [Acidobacteriota bacterium]
MDLESLKKLAQIFDYAGKPLANSYNGGKVIPDPNPVGTESWDARFLSCFRARRGARRSSEYCFVRNSSRSGRWITDLGFELAQRRKLFTE